MPSHSASFMQNEEYLKNMQFYKGFYEALYLVYSVTPRASLKAVVVRCGSALLTHDDSRCSLARELFIVIGSLGMS